MKLKTFNYYILKYIKIFYITIEINKYLILRYFEIDFNFFEFLIKLD